MPYRLVVVDDEDMIREGLAKYVNWEAIGFTIAGQFRDGKDAADFIDKNHVDVVLTDIKMTYMSGIELAKYVYEKQPHIKVVLISGYKEFEYARDAISYSVAHYLLKPTKLDELKNVFEKIKSSLDAEKEKGDKVAQEKGHYEEILPYLREEFFNDLICGVLRKKEILLKKLRILGLNIDPEKSRVCVLKVKLCDYDGYIDSKWEYEKHTLDLAVKNYLSVEDKGVYYYSVYGNHDIYKVIAVSTEPMDELTLRNQITLHFDSSGLGLRSIFGIDIDVEIVHSYETIMEASECNPFNSLSNGKADERTYLNYSNKIEEWQMIFVSYIGAGKYEEVYALLDSFLQSIQDLEIKAVRNILVDLFAGIISRLKNIGMQINSAIEMNIYYDTVLQTEDLHQIKMWCKSNFNNMLNHTEKQREITEKQVIVMAKEYIKKNYAEDISLVDVAEHVYLSAVYFCRIFKQETGENFIDYLIKVRMDMAKEFLKQLRFKTYEVSSMVGYKTTKHFSKLFKQYTGLTPTEYRRNILGEDWIPSDE